MFYNLTNNDNVWTFYTDSYAVGTTTAWQTWSKPIEFNNFMFMLSGGGGGGCPGQVTASGVAGYGGGGGAGGTLTTAYIPSFLLPDILHIQTGAGGAIGNVVGSGYAGQTTYISYYPNTLTGNVLLSATGGFGAITTAGGVVGTIYNPTQSIMMFSGASATGAAGGAAGSNPGVSFISTASAVYGGAGGGAKDAANVGYAGGNISASNIHPQLDGGAASGGNGNSGYLIKKPFTAIGGSGGGGNGAGIGGVGGNGAWGSGGGGGGAGTVAGGYGGAGGNGFVIIIGY